MSTTRRAPGEDSGARLSMKARGRPKKAPARTAGIAVVAAIAGVILAWAVLLPRIEAIPRLLIRDAGGGVIADIALPDGSFAHRYVHSIHKTPVDEEFRVQDGTLVLFRLRYDSYGVGMPTDAGEGFRIESGRFVLDLHRSFPSIALRVSHVPGDGILLGAEGSGARKFHPFTEWTPAESLIVLAPGLRREIHFGR